ncbi:hypothetical protein RJ640_003605 [Escallonia rubra]|uniref:CCHC-type domain-containing protein n=1 Tax=Escallonia rubra TaxID=112253 RepID=A0AA88RIJ4_9ASTE|nr:hypothetical protein RJ640_003605 [Escallonia rubra]
METIINQTKSLQCDDFIDLEEDELNASVEAALTLVIKAISTKTIFLKPLQNILLKAWNPSKGMKIRHIQGNIFSVSFNHEWDRKRIMDSRPWSIMNSHLVVREWPPNCAIEDVQFDYSPFWVRILGLPPNQMTKNNAVKIGSRIGKVLDIDFTSDGQISWNNYLRLQVEINITQPLHSGFHRSSTATSNSWINLRYERLPDFCFNCGRLGHVQRGCAFPPSPAQLESRNPFGPWLRANFDGICPSEAEWNPNLIGRAAAPNSQPEQAGRRRSIPIPTDELIEVATSPSDKPTFHLLSTKNLTPDSPSNPSDNPTPFFPHFKPLSSSSSTPNPLLSLLTPQAKPEPFAVASGFLSSL